MPFMTYTAAFGIMIPKDLDRDTVISANLDLLGWRAARELRSLTPISRDSIKVVKIYRSPGVVFKFDFSAQFYTPTGLAALWGTSFVKAAVLQNRTFGNHFVMPGSDSHLLRQIFEGLS